MYPLMPGNLTQHHLCGVNAKPLCGILGTTLTLSCTLGSTFTLHLVTAASQGTRETECSPGRCSTCTAHTRRNSTFLPGHMLPLGSKLHCHNTSHILPFWPLLSAFSPNSCHTENSSPSLNAYLVPGALHGLTQLTLL